MYWTVFINIAFTMLVLTTLFTLATLPVEKNASDRAYSLLKETNALDEEELVGAKKVLSAAGFTYMASFIVSVLNLLRFIMLFTRRR